ncbi:Acyltransferase family protein [Streptomyces sp. YIM 130001]|uniref:acyltransferase family protein n=1 Tax=Streptomyces sp. YIM 130001 TaxID=2259644 RepID=UPI000EF01174|nr:acyltransferase [Streptomyces sp. YIM 130001]RII19824.1 Acyltransferase family protein [Streptomyces sp. YIM 130001]
MNPPDSGGTRPMPVVPGASEAGGGQVPPQYGRSAAYPAQYGAPGAPTRPVDPAAPGAPVTAGAPAQPSASEKPAVARSKPGRDRYLDLLRSLALVRVVFYHIFGWAWLTVLFPSMGVMFALAGSLMARSLSRPAWGVIRGRVRRLLPPVWVFGAAVLPIMLLGGWNPAKDLGGTWFLQLLNYIVPVGAPPYPWQAGDPGGLLEETWAVQAAGPLWYIRAYLWFVIASPLLLWAFRRVPWATLLAPLALTAVVGTGLVKIPGETGNAVTDFAVYGSCWVLGFAHQEGVLKQIPRYLAVSLAALFMAFGLWWAAGHLGPDGWDLNDIPLAQATWSFGFVVILLQYAPSWQQLPGKLAQFDKLITLSNNRAVTIYLWHNALIMATIPLLDQVWNVPFLSEHFGDAFSTTYTLWMFVLVWPLIGLMIVSVGWVEDLAAKRSRRLWPNGTKPRPSRSGRRAAAGGSHRR